MCNRLLSLSAKLKNRGEKIQPKQKTEKGQMRTKQLKRKGARNLSQCQRQRKELVRGVYGPDFILYLMSSFRPASLKEGLFAVKYKRDLVELSMHGFPR